MKKQNNMDRRTFLKHLGVGAAATTAALAGCNRNSNPITGDIAAQGEVPVDKMSYRANPKNGDKVSLLGYGCMRWPTVSDPSGDGEIIDQDAVNDLVDYALAHGIGGDQDVAEQSRRYGRSWRDFIRGISIHIITAWHRKGCFWLRWLY